MECPAGHASNGEERNEKVVGDAEQGVDRPGPQVHIGSDTPLGPLLHGFGVCDGFYDGEPFGLSAPFAKGFGLGFAIREDLGLAGEPGSEGEFGWGGAYASQYWVDPKEHLTVSYMVQLLPSGDNDIPGKLRALIYQAME